MLPTGWTRHWDEQFEKFYYRNEEGVITWRHPVLKKVDAGAGAGAAGSGATYTVNEDARKADFD